MFNIYWIIIIAFVIIVPTFITMTNVLSGNISLWYDNARDLLSAWDNLSKMTLIGPTSGIPGIFYGPYWIWLLSFALIYSKDPVIVTLIVSTVPYMVIFPLILLKFCKYIKKDSLIAAWVIFAFGIGSSYASGLWNPFPAVLLYLILIYILIKLQLKNINIKYLLIPLFTGILSGLMINFHISFGIGIFLGLLIYLVGIFIFAAKGKSVDTKLIVKNFLINITFIGVGVILVFIPSIIFEIRHGFNQIIVIMTTFSQYGDVINIKGLTKIQIVENFFNRFSELVGVNNITGYFIFISVVTLSVYLKFKKRIEFNEEELKLLWILISGALGTLIIYLTAKNPVWGYHFIGLEIMYLLLLALLINKTFLLRVVFVISAVYVFVSSTISFSRDFTERKKQIAGLNEVIKTVSTIEKDAGNKPYTFFAFSPSIYIYEYSYIYRWLYDKNVPYDPGNMPNDSKVVYVVVPKDKSNPEEGFISYVTPSKSYRTVKIFEVGSNINILRREKIN